MKVVAGSAGPRVCLCGSLGAISPRQSERPEVRAAHSAAVDGEARGLPLAPSFRAAPTPAQDAH
jgi:hypothetical protein